MSLYWRLKINLVNAVKVSQRIDLPEENKQYIGNQLKTRSS